MSVNLSQDEEDKFALDNVLGYFQAYPCTGVVSHYTFLQTLVTPCQCKLESYPPSVQNSESAPDGRLDTVGEFIKRLVETLIG